MVRKLKQAIFSTNLPSGTGFKNNKEFVTKIQIYITPLGPTFISNFFLLFRELTVIKHEFDTIYTDIFVDFQI